MCKPVRAVGLAGFVVANLALFGAAWAEKILDPRQPEAVATYLRGQGFQCPAVTELRREGQTNRGNLYRVGCGSAIGATSRWYQMILSPDESHVSLYPCAGAAGCPVQFR